MSTVTTPPVLDAEFLASKHNAGLSFDEYVSTAKPDKQEAWRAVYDQVELTEPHKTLIASFTREMKILVSSGVWCGDCVQQCPLLARIAEASDLIDLRFVDRDEHADLSQRIMLCQGLRVPTAVFMAEDYEFIGLFGDRTLTRCRSMAAQQLGANCPLPGAPIPTDELRATLGDWLNEIERLQLLLRLSPRLRQKHGD